MQDENALLCEKQQHTCSQWYLEIPSNTKQTSSQFENVTKKRAHTHTHTHTQTHTRRKTQQCIFSPRLQELKFHTMTFWKSLGKQ